MSDKPKTIYVVEDEVSARNMMLDFLSQYKNANARGFFTGDACIKEIVNGHAAVPDLILMDYFLDASIDAKYDGLDTLAKIKEICPETKVIMFTSVENERIIKLAREKGAFEYIVKGKDGFDKLKNILDVVMN